MIDISNMNKVTVLSKLFNNSKAQGMGFLQSHSTEMTKDEAQELLNGNTYFDYVRGRVIKVDLSGDSLDPRLYDRDNGQGAAERALN